MTVSRMSNGLRLGTIHLWGDSLANFREEVRLADELGFSLIGLGDSPAGWHELYGSLAVAAHVIKRATLAPMVTAPFLRHPLITANAMSTLGDMVDGRVALGFATGGGTALATGYGQATLARMRSEIGALRDLFAGRETTWEERPNKSLRFPRPVPIHLSAVGPKAMALAGELADGVILFSNMDLDALDVKIAAVRAAAKAAGRDPLSIDIWVVSYCSIRDSADEAVDDLKAFLVAAGMALRAPGAIDTVPPKYRKQVEEMFRRYDVTEHVVVGGRNVKMMEELGLTNYLRDFDSVYGTEAEVRKVLDGMAERGVSTFIAPLPGHADPLGTIRRLGALLEKN
ncbi:MAG: coenzyme F420-dependent N10-methylene tetrahydromethanopterin reductase-like protein [Verrucomicrobiaceae bacterium]|nr:coenzyme F420-dependent N10-methylene tetrahydromethanopterin reductase-like protein [Verrucomicrobiaceae bacterium]